MPDSGTRPSASIGQEVLLTRLAQSEQMRAFFIQMWLQNPSLAAGAGRRVQEILSPVSAAAADDENPGAWATPCA